MRSVPARVGHGRALALAVSLLAAGAGQPARAGSGGPDAAGYTWRDVNSGGCPVEDDAFVLVDSAEFVQDFIGPIDLGFDFPFYERVMTRIWVNRSGLVFLGPPANLPYSANQPIPLPAAPDGFIAAYWDEMEDAAPPSVSWQRFASLGYFKVSTRRQPVGSAEPVELEVYLHENGDVRIEHVRAPSPPFGGTIGIESFDGDVGLEVFRDGVGSGGFDFPNPEPHAVCFERRPSLDCSSPRLIGCGTVLGTTRPGGASMAWSWSCTPGSWTGAEAVHQVTLDAVTDLYVAVTATGGGELGAFLLSDCDELTCISGGVGQFFVEGAPPGTYLLAVDARTPADEGEFTLEVECTAVSTPIACGASRGGDTTGGPSRLDVPECVAQTDLAGPEAYFTVDFAPPGNLDVTLASSTGQGVFIHDTSEPLDRTRCLAGGFGGVTLFAPPAGSYVLAVDGPLGSDGPFTLTLRCDPRLDCAASAGDLPCNGIVSGTASNGPSQVERYACTSLTYPGSEAIYTFVNPMRQVVSFLLDDSLDPGLDLLLLDACNEGTCRAVGDDEIDVELPPGTYRLVVDGRSATTAAFTVTAACGNALEPSTVSWVAAPGECFDEVKTAWLTPAIAPTDVLLAIDLTSSMMEERAQLAANLQDIAAQLETFLPDVAFGLASYKDYPWLQSYAQPCSYDATRAIGYGISPDYPYRLHQPITTDRQAMQVAMNALPPAAGGLDLPESVSRLLDEAVRDPNVGWRPGARRVLIDFGDSLPHDCNVLECLGEVDGGNRGIDLGRDGTPGTFDDLRILDVVQGLADAGIMLVHFDTSGGLRLVGGHRYEEVWECWAAWTGGVARTLNTDGTVPPALHPEGLPGLVRDVVRQRTLECDPLELIASPGYESWLTAVTPGPTSLSLPAVRRFDIRICVPVGTPAGAHDFEVLATCGGRTVASQQVHVDVVTDCTPVVRVPPPNPATCEGGTARLDATGVVILNCAGGVDKEWTDGTTTWPLEIVDVTPADTTTYTVTVSCDADPSCATSVEATVDVHHPPLLDGAAALDASPCDTGLELSWFDAVFRGPSGTGTYAVYRSETSCADALAAGPLVTGLTLPSWTDDTTEAGRSYVYVVEAEDDRTSTPCTPRGASHGGAAAHDCTGLAVADVVDATVPDGVYATLRVAHRRGAADPVGHLVTASWLAARTLLAGEHFHLSKAMDAPTNPFVMINAEGDVARSFTEDDRRSPLQFFDLRVASRCEVVSAPEYPPGLP